MESALQRGNMAIEFKENRYYQIIYTWKTYSLTKKFQQQKGYIKNV